jgi:Type I phosphodiesterase / nucleotide pyrophosphatase
MKRVGWLIAVGVSLLAVSLVGGARVERAHADSAVCTPCVLLIEVDGLEAKDVTPQTTPFLWALAHAGNVAQDPTASPASVGAAQTPGISGRAGFIWQAPRGVMTATTAAATASLITGGYPQQHGVFSNEYFEGTKHLLMGAAPDSQDPVDIMLARSSLPELITEQSDNKASAWLGDARLAGLFPDVLFKPTPQDSVPAYCPPPQDMAEAQDYQTKFADVSVSCPTADINTLNHAETDLSTEGTGGRVTLGYIYLAELGAIKRIYGDADNQATPAGQAVASQLATTDAAIGAFVNKYQHDQTDKWNNTVLMVVGNHGYELTPSTHRVPDPDPANQNNPGMGLADVVSRESGGTARFVPQGTMGTVYSNDHNPATLAKVAKAIMAINAVPACNAGSEANNPSTPPASSGCIDAVLATGAVTVPDVATVADAHHDWDLHYTDSTGKPSGADGDLLVLLKPHWAAGQLVPIKNTAGSPIPDTANTYAGTGQISNPYFGSPGGPRNRSIAAIVNGRPDIVRQGPIQVYPVSATGVDEDACLAAPVDATKVVDVNADPSDDANAIGHECQAETVDFMPTIAALLHISVPNAQLAGRFLREAFTRTLAAPRSDDVQQDVIQDDPPPPPEPDVQVPPQPEPPEGFLYAGLLRGLKASVADKHGCTWDRARQGAKMDYLQIEGDFGKAYSSTTLTFYRRGAAAARRSRAHRAGATARMAKNTPGKKPNGWCLPAPTSHPRAGKAAAAARPPLSAIARFNPFLLKRGHVVLTLKIPDLYRPTHVGLFVQEARKFDVPQVGPDGKPGLNFVGFGPAAGTIVSVIDGIRLHAVKRVNAKAQSKQPHPRPKKN